MRSSNATSEQGLSVELDPSGSVTSPEGFTAGVAACGLKDSEALDLALVLSERPCSAAAVFTRNRVAAAPVIVDRETLARDSKGIRCVVANAGIANACTGPPGVQAARETQRIASVEVGCEPGQVLVLSTGVIGEPLEVARLENGIQQAAARAGPDQGIAAATAIMTTDTRPKHARVQVDLPEGRVTLGGIAKGAGMIHPDMATMLAVITTDAAGPPRALRDCLAGSVERSFNRISVDGDTSTNDTVLLLANGVSRVSMTSKPARQAFRRGLDRLCQALAQAIVRDGEGASKFVTLRVTGAESESDALKVGRSVATSPLVKTALAGGDPNWGRILAAAGRAGVDLEPERIYLWAMAEGVGEVPLVRAGIPAGVNQERAKRAFDSGELTLRLDLGMGEAGTTLWTCDLTQEYVRINAEYHT